MLHTLFAADELASRHVPVFFLQLYLATITLWLGGTECDADVMDGFWGVWPVFLAASWLGGMYTSWYSRAGAGQTFSQRAAWSLLESLQSPLYFIAFSFARAKPFKCIPGHGDSLAYTVAPVMLVVLYLGSIAYYYGIVRRLEPSAVDKFNRMDVNGSGSENVAPLVPDGDISAVGRGTGPGAAFTHATLLGRATAALVRRKIPLTMILVHFLVVSLAIPGDACQDGHTGWFTGYYVTLALCVAAFRYAMSRRVRTGFTGVERQVWAMSEALQSVLYFTVFVLLRGKPVKCFSAGLALAYATSVPLLIATNMYAVAASYLWLRSYTVDQLVDMQVFPNRKTA